MYKLASPSTLALTLALALALGGCGGGGSDPAPPASGPVAPQKTTNYSFTNYGLG